MRVHRQGLIGKLKQVVAVANQTQRIAVAEEWRCRSSTGYWCSSVSALV
jgi:hypothetical protein